MYTSRTSEGEEKWRGTRTFSAGVEIQSFEGCGGRNGDSRADRRFSLTLLTRTKILLISVPEYLGEEGDVGMPVYDKIRHMYT